MEATLKDGWKLCVNSEERIYAMAAPGEDTIPIVIDQAEGERLLIEYAEQLQQEIIRLNHHLLALEHETELDKSILKKTIAKQQQEIERLKVVEQAYEALKKAL